MTGRRLDGQSSHWMRFHHKRLEISKEREREDSKENEKDRAGPKCDSENEATTTMTGRRMIT